MTTLTIQVPDSEVLKVSNYIKHRGGKVSQGEIKEISIEEQSYSNLDDHQINPMTLAYAEGSLKEGWDLSEEENEYWNSFAK